VSPCCLCNGPHFEPMTSQGHFFKPHLSEMDSPDHFEHLHPFRSLTGTVRLLLATMRVADTLPFRHPTQPAKYSTFCTEYSLARGPSVMFYFSPAQMLNTCSFFFCFMLRPCDRLHHLSHQKIEPPANRVVEYSLARGPSVMIYFSVVHKLNKGSFFFCFMLRTL
jgi:hypothetical protein